MPLQIGSVLRNRYRIDSVLGRGGMGAVFRAEDTNLGVVVAVKENLFTTEDYARQFRREANILASLRHPNLPRVTDHFVIEGQGQYLVMDFIEGEDLRQRLERDGAADEGVVADWFLEVADALAFLHSRNPPILHRDVKPGNIRVTPDGRAILVDFGLAKVVGESGSTTTGAKAMTPGFSPPEQYGTGRTDPRTDVYSLGASMYAALTAEIPEDSLERAMGRAELTPLRKRNSSVTPAVAQMVEKSLAVRPEDRFQSTGEFAVALRAAGGTTRATAGRHYPYLEKTKVSGGNTLAVGGIPAARVEPVRGGLPRWVFVVGGIGALAILGALALPGLGSILSGRNGGPTPSSGSATAVGAVGATSPGGGPSPTGIAAASSATTVSVGGVTQTPGPTPIGGGVGQIAFASARTGLPQIFLVNVDGTGITQITTNADGACQPSWAPDGQRLVFTSPCRVNQVNYAGSGLWIINLDGSSMQPLRTEPGGDYDPSWGPDGNQIAFASIRNVRPQVLLYNLETGEVTALSGRFDYDTQPSWAPDGSFIAFASTRSEEHQLYYGGAEGGGDDRLARGGKTDSHPDWSHDGVRILYERQLGGVPRLFNIRFEEHGGVGQQVCPEGPLALQPMAEGSWSPDDQWITMETWPTGSNHDIAIMTNACSNYILLAAHPAADFDPAWRP
jgi:predicted Ser/Thr protein kinase